MFANESVAVVVQVGHSRAIGFADASAVASCVVFVSDMLRCAKPLRAANRA